MNKWLKLQTGMKNDAAILILVLSGFLFGACSKQKSDTIPRWLLPAEVRMIESDEEFLQVFRGYEGTVQLETVQSETSVFRIIHMSPNSGASTYPALVYERIDVDLWHLRAAVWLYYSHSGKVVVSAITNGISLRHDGTNLFEVHSSRDQELRQRESALKR